MKNKLGTFISSEANRDLDFIDAPTQKYLYIYLTHVIIIVVCSLLPAFRRFSGYSSESFAIHPTDIFRLVQVDPQTESKLKNQYVILLDAPNP